MPFQQTVREVQTTGIIGDIIYEGPTRAHPLNLNSGGVTPNTIGNAFTYITGEDEGAAAGAAGGGAFAGILAFSKEYATAGTTAGALEPTLDLPDHTNASLLTMGTMVVNLSVVGTGEIGEGLFYDDVTGALGSGTAVPPQVQITNSKIVRKNISAPGLAIIQLTEPS